MKYIHKNTGITVEGNYSEGYRNITTPYFWVPCVLIENCPDWEKVKEPIPLFTTEDGVKVFENYRNVLSTVFSDFSFNYDCSLHQIKSDTEFYPEVKIFSTKEAAEEYIERYKPVLSFSDIANEVNYSSDSQQSLLIRLKELIKTKI